MDCCLCTKGYRLFAFRHFFKLLLNSKIPSSKLKVISRNVGMITVKEVK